jgi:hypothetical protein
MLYHSLSCNDNAKGRQLFNCFASVLRNETRATEKGKKKRTMLLTIGINLGIIRVLVEGSEVQTYYCFSRVYFKRTGRRTFASNLYILCCINFIFYINCLKEILFEHTEC